MEIREFLLYILILNYVGLVIFVYFGSKNLRLGFFFYFYNDCGIIILAYCINVGIRSIIGVSVWNFRKVNLNYFEL